MNNSQNRFIAPFSILSVAIVLAVFIFGMSWKSVRSENQTITVTGSAKMEITSDLGILKGQLNSFAGSSRDAYNAVSAQKPMLLEYLKSKGFPGDKVEFMTFNVFPQYQYSSEGSQQRVIGYSASQPFQIESKDVNLIKTLSLEISSLIANGVEIQMMPPEFYYTKLADVKIDIQAEAAKDAKMRAEKIAGATGSSLGTMRTAKMGVLQITPPNSNMISDYGMNDVSSIRKEITAVVNASFEIQ